MWRNVAILFVLTALVECCFVATYYYEANGPLAAVFAEHSTALATNTIPPANEIDMFNDPWVKVAHFESQVGQVSFVIGILMSFIVSLGIIFGGISSALVQRARALTPHVHLARALYLIMLTGVLALIDTPLLFSGFAIDTLRGTSYPTPGYVAYMFAQDFFLNTFFTLLTVVPLYWIIDRYTKYWWIVAAVFMSVFTLFSAYLSPILIDPLYDDLQPLGQGMVKDSLRDILHATGVPDDRVFVSNASATTFESNAMVTGLWSTKRVILDDTLLMFFTPQEIRVIVAHELGHYVLHHLWYDMIIATALTFLTFCVIAYAMRFLIMRYGKKIGATRINDIVLFPVISMLMFVIPFFTAPLESYISRSFEHQADVFETELAKDPQSSIDGFKKMAYQSFVDVNPPRILQVWFGTHPTFVERIEYYESQK